MLKRFAVVIVVAALAVGLIPTVSAAPKAQLSTCGTDQNVTLTFIAGQVGDEHNLYVKLADEYTANVCPNITVNVGPIPAVLCRPKPRSGHVHGGRGLAGPDLRTPA